MAGYVGALKEIALTQETTKGTAESPSSGDWLKHDGFAFGPQINKLEDTLAMGRIEGLNRRDINQKWSEGSIAAAIRSDQLVTFSELIMGAEVSPAGGAYAWTGVTNTNNHVSYTVSVIDPVDGDLAYPGGMLNSFSLDSSPDDYPRIDMDLMAGKEESATLTGAYTAESSVELYRPQDVNVYIEADYASLSGATAVSLENVNINVNKNLTPAWVLGSTEATEFINQRFRANGTLTFKYDSDTYKTLGLADTAKAIKVSLSKGTYDWDFIFPSVTFSDWNDSEDNDAYMTNTVSFEVDFQDTTNGFMQIALATT